MRNGSMFAELTQYKEAEFFKVHPLIVLYTPEKTLRLRVLGAYPARASYKQRETYFAETQDFREFTQNVLDQCEVDDVKADDISRLYTFATCSYEWYNTRTWVHAIEWEDTL